MRLFPSYGREPSGYRGAGAVTRGSSEEEREFERRPGFPFAASRIAYRMNN